MIKTGLFGGSFNPIHTGHISLARLLLHQCGLDEIWFVVSPQNPFKTGSKLLDDDMRLRLVSEALRNEPGLVASDYEFRLPKPSYTWNTLQHLRKDYPDRLFTLLIGGDNWTAFDRWFHHDDILANYPIIVYPRQGENIDPKKLPAGVTLTDTPLLNISSTEIRARVRYGEDITGMVPETIKQQVITLYRKQQ